MATKNLSEALKELGFLKVFDVTELPNKPVKAGTPYTADKNNGVFVIYDEEGKPWIHAHKFVDQIALRELFVTHILQWGAYVPFSNDGGRFVREFIILPSLNK